MGGCNWKQRFLVGDLIHLSFGWSRRIAGGGRQICFSGALKKNYPATLNKLLLKLGLACSRDFHMQLSQMP